MPTPPAAGAAPHDPFESCQPLFEQSHQPTVAVRGPGHVIRYANPAFGRLAGRSPGELVGRPYADAIPEGVANGRLALLDRVLRTGLAENLPEQEHWGDPPSFWSYAAWAATGPRGEPDGVLLQVTDSTEAAVFRRHAVAMNEALLVSSVRQHELLDEVRAGAQARRDLESQMFKAQKLESLGVLAGGVAHDLNNILTPVLGFAELARISLPAGSAPATLVEEVALNARRAADLVQQILSYAGMGHHSEQWVDLSALVRGMGGLLKAAALGVEVHYDLAAGLPPVAADATQLRQVVLNLVTNAAEATANGVGVRVAVSRVEVAADSVWSAHLKSHLPAGPHVALEVVDGGCGMAPAVVERIFDPFFTTKFTGRGLGLAAVQGIAHRHRGVIRVTSEPGRGSAFRLLLPAAAGPAPPPPAPAESDAWRGSGTVLVIDDDDAVRDVTARQLKRGGFAVLAAASGAAGLDILAGGEGDIDAAVVDVTMPGLGGLETLAALRDRRPGLPAVLMSGFSVQKLSTEVANPVRTRFVQKPFTGAALLTALRAVLERTSHT